MSITKTPDTIQAAVSVAAGLTRSNAFASAAKDVSTYRRGTIGWELANGSSSPGAPAQIVLQQSTDGTLWTDFYLAGGNTNNSGSTAYSDPAGMPTGSCDLPPGAIKVRALCYGHTTNAVRLTVTLAGEVG